MGRRRAAAFEAFSGAAFPSEAEEVWRYSGIDAFDIANFAPVSGSASSTRTLDADLTLAKDIAQNLGPRSSLIVTRDGVVSSIETDPDLSEGSLRVASARDDQARGEIEEWLGALAGPRDAFGSLHDAFLADVVLVSVRSKSVLVHPVVVIHLVSMAAQAGGASPLSTAPSIFPRTLIQIGRSAEAGVIELVASTRGGVARVAPAPTPLTHERASIGTPGVGALVVPVTELEVADDARLQYANLQDLNQDCVQVALQTSRVQRDGSLRSFTASLGGSYARVRTDSDVAGQAAEASLLAAYLGTDDQVHDFRTLQDHHGARTRSELLFEGAVADRARSVYSGLIRIARGAHGADAFQTNHNLVLSEGAHADSVPNLEIDENDVRCSHASTVGPIDEEQRYYLESRGIEPSVAERLIVLGFFSAIAARAPFEGVRRFLETVVAQRLSGRLPSEQSETESGVGRG